MFKYVFATPETNLFQLVNEVRSRKEETNLFMRDSHEKELFTEKMFCLEVTNSPIADTTFSLLLYRI